MANSTDALIIPSVDLLIHLEMQTVAGIHELFEGDVQYPFADV